MIELMIVVAIIGLLAAIAIPNYLKFQCKAKQAEAKAGLGALFVSEKTFFADHNTYGTDLVSVGWEPEGAPLYLFGFRPGIQYPTTLVGVPWFPTRNNTLEPSVVGSPPRYQTGRTIRLTDSTPLDAASDLPALTACDGGGFVIGAAGDINPDIGSGIDKWFMTQQRELMTQLNDCTSGQ